MHGTIPAELVREFITACGLDPAMVCGFRFDARGLDAWIVTFERYKVDGAGRRYADPLRFNVAATELVDVRVTGEPLPCTAD